MSLYRRINIAFFTTNLNPYGFICANRKKSVCNLCARTSRVACTIFKSSFTKYTIIILTLFVSISQDKNGSSVSFFILVLFIFVVHICGRSFAGKVVPHLVYDLALMHRIMKLAKNNKIRTKNNTIK